MSSGTPAMAEEEDPYRFLLMLRHLDAPSQAAAISLILREKPEALIDLDEEFVTFAEFALGEDHIITSEKPVGYDPAQAHLGIEEKALAPRVQVAMFLSVHALLDIFKAGWCPRNFTAANLTLSKATMVPKFVNPDLQLVTDELIEDCLKSLAKVFEGDLLQGLSLPYEVKHFLSVMKHFPLDLLPLVLYHPCLLPMENRCDYFARMYGYLRYILKVKNKVAYDFVIANIKFPRYWDTKLRTNKYLKQFFVTADPSVQYYPLGRSAPIPTPTQWIRLTDAQKTAFWSKLTKDQKTVAEEEATEEVLRYHRNLPAHVLQLAAATNSFDGMLFNRTGAARMLYSILDGVMVALAECLARVSHFYCLDLESLFPGRVVAK